MEKILIYFDETKYNSDISNINDVLKSLQEIIEKWNTLNLGVFEKYSLQELLNDTENFWFEQTMKSPKYAPQSEIFEKHELRKLVKKTEGYYDLYALVKKFHKKISSRETTLREDNLNYFSFFEFGEEGPLKLDESALPTLKEKHTKYAETERSQLVFEVVKKINSALNESDIFNKTKFIYNQQHFTDFFSNVLKFDYVNQKTAINFDAIKMYDRP